MTFTGKVAFITGASRGIGKAIALELAELGTDIAFNHYKDEKAAQEVEEKVKAFGRRVANFDADVASFSQAQEVVAETVKIMGRLDILVNNAGINRDAVSWKMTEEDWDRVLAVDLKGCFNYCRAAIPVFRQQRAGKIVNIASINALRGKFGQANYAAAKAGVIGLTKTLAKELGRDNINVNCVAPGFVLTEMTEKMSPAAKEQAIAEIVLGRPGLPEDVAMVVVFLCSEGARHVTGEVIKVDGGQYI